MERASYARAHTYSHLCAHCSYSPRPPTHSLRSFTHQDQTKCGHLNFLLPLFENDLGCWTADCPHCRLSLLAMHATHNTLPLPSPPPSLFLSPFPFSFLCCQVGAWCGRGRCAGASGGGVWSNNRGRKVRHPTEARRRRARHVVLIRSAPPLWRFVLVFVAAIVTPPKQTTSQPNNRPKQASATCNWPENIKTPFPPPPRPLPNAQRFTHLLRLDGPTWSRRTIGSIIPQTFWKLVTTFCSSGSHEWSCLGST